MRARSLILALTSFKVGILASYTSNPATTRLLLFKRDTPRSRALRFPPPLFHVLSAFQPFPPLTCFNFARTPPNTHYAPVFMLLPTSLTASRLPHHSLPTLSHATSTQPRVPNLATSLRFHLVSFRVGRMLTPTGACDLETRAIQTFHNRWNHFIIVKQLVFLYVHDWLHRNVGAYSGRFGKARITVMGPILVRQM